MQHRVFEDNETAQMIEAAKHRYTKLKKNLKSMAGPRGYAGYFGNWVGDNTADVGESDLDSLRDRFTKKIFDDRLSEALPYVQRAYQEFQMNETQMSQEFEQWADGMVETIGAGQAGDQDIQTLRNLMQAELPVGTDGSQAIAAINRLISDTTLHDNLYELSQIAGETADARPVIYQWAQDNRPDIAAKLDYVSESTPNIEEQSEYHVAEESIDFIRYLAGLKR
jgi:hypothetical protein